MFWKTLTKIIITEYRNWEWTRAYYMSMLFKLPLGLRFTKVGWLTVALATSMLCTATITPEALAMNEKIQVPDSDGTPHPPDCSSINHNLRISTGLILPDKRCFLLDDTINLSTPAKIEVEYGSLCELPNYVALPSFEWRITRPDGTDATVSGAGTLHPTLYLDYTGDYTILFTACPGGCDFTFPDGSTGHLDETVFTRTLPVGAGGKVPPETIPILPPLANSCAGGDVPSLGCGVKSELSGQCYPGKGGLTTPQWTTVEWFDYTTSSYKKVEGLVTKSWISRKDSPLNHDSQDLNFRITPDPRYTYLMQQGQGALEAEWEEASIPNQYRPALGDRVSVFGYWIRDCGHPPYNTEIHPPVGIAVHRNRPIHIPATEMFSELGGENAGANVYTPGVITDIWFNNRSGQIQSCDVLNYDVQLAQPYDESMAQCTRSTTEATCAVALTSQPNCIPDQYPSPLDGTFSFNIYLPKNPRTVMEEAGVTDLPPVPLYYDVDYTSCTGSTCPDPLIEKIEEGGIMYLKVTVNLTGYSGSTYAGRIAAGWVYPDEDNWLLEKWKLRINEIDVHYDGDDRLRGDGEWSLWVYTNNATNYPWDNNHRPEWTKIIHYDVDDGIEDFRGRPWETDAPDHERNLGPDLLRYPDRWDVCLPQDNKVIVHASGYEEDNFSSDDLGLINDEYIPREWPRNIDNECRRSVDFALPGAPDYDAILYSGCASYTLNYDLIRGTAVGAATLSQAAQDLSNEYFNGSMRRTGALPSLVQQPAFHPHDIVLETGQSLNIFQTPPFRQQPLEPNTINDISIADFYDTIADTVQIDPAKALKRIAGLRQVIDEKLSNPSLAPDVYADLPILKAALPAKFWKNYFDDITIPPPPQSTPKSIVEASGVLGSDSAGSADGNLTAALHCAPNMLPNNLTMSWENSSFVLDVILRNTCEDDPGTANPPGASFDKVKGVGVGKLNGVPGVYVVWEIRNQGSSSGSGTAAIIIYDPRNVGSTTTFTSASTTGIMITMDDVNHPPVATAGPDQTVEATSPSGASMTLDGTGSSDPDDDPLTLTWNGPFGSASGATPTVNLPIGANIITLTANDPFGNNDTDTVQLTVQDITAPILTAPSNITVDATGPTGTIVNFTVTASDIVDPSPVVSCTPASGSMFPIGTTTVSCTATDASGNSTGASFNITVKGAVDQITDLTQLIKGFNLKKGIENSINMKLRNAIGAVQRGNITAACNLLNAFINEVRAQTGKAITLDQANQLIAEANQIMAVLGCT